MLVLFLLIIFIIGFCIYMYLNDGYIYIATNKFEKEISIKKIKEKNEPKQQRCEKCGGPLDTKFKICSKCIKKDADTYSSSNPLAEKNKRGNF